MKKLRTTTLLLLSLMVLSVTYFTSCSREEEKPPVDTPKFGNDTIDLANGWKFDKSHSSVLWETPYVGTGGLLTGRFNQFFVKDFYFDEDELAKTKFTGWVYLNTVNTGEPGRDTGCLATTFNVKGTPDSTVNCAVLKLKKIEFGSQSKHYNITCDLTFNGVTSEVKGNMVFTGKTFYPAGQVSTKAQDVAGLTITYTFAAKSVHKLVSNNIPDNVDVKINSTFKRVY